MKYDYLKKVDVNTYPNENIEIQDERAYKPIKLRGKKERKKRNITPFGIIFTQLSLCILASLVFMAVTLITKAEELGIADVFRSFFTDGKI